MRPCPMTITQSEPEPEWEKAKQNMHRNTRAIAHFYLNEFYSNLYNYTMLGDNPNRATNNLHFQLEVN